MVDYLLAEGHRVRALTHKNRERLQHLIDAPHDSFECLQGDLSDYAFVREAVEGADGVFHFAALSRATSPLPECTDANVVGTQNVLRALADVTSASPASADGNSASPASADGKNGTLRRPKMVFASSALIYGNAAAPQSEDAPHDLRTPYALTKFVAEKYCEYFSEHQGVPTVRLRIFLVYGERESGTLVAIFRRLKREGKPVTIFGDGSTTRDFVHVSDVCEAAYRSMMLMCEGSLPSSSSLALNVGTGVETSIKQVADIISPDAQTHQPPRPNDCERMCADVSRMERVLKWRPQTDFVAWLRETVMRDQEKEAGDQT
ncbi:unnamed protein product [Vitrella brassicaformis CCMP3155]|uniref:NAD-dependent epimerase/dehydratase domain-containing protein n=1 Tax=Vitrella brassicaformis (strain CCMP3155) TaxID=1169540 RepID=A0A0G4ED18_VITBC|nr:unnamed protein product [Vitrella brassicaformis CCMP3155]|eukprot:CEL93890.1 unnamed protein product [Vitrella brassicaformis CCMP3155]